MKNLTRFITPIFVTLAVSLCLVGIVDAIRNKTNENDTNQMTNIRSDNTPDPFERKANFISGPLASKVGELCVFNLGDPKSKADWAIIRQSPSGPPVNAYVDSSGSSVVFSAHDAANYTVVAAVIDDGTPKILQHICEYGVAPEPKPDPQPQPPPVIEINQWVAQNVPEAGKSEAGILASIYESAAQGIKHDTIKTPDAAFSIIRTNTQTKIKIVVWNDFLDRLSEKISEKLGENPDAKQLGTVFSQIAEGLKSVSVEPPKVSPPPAVKNKVAVKTVTPRVQGTSYYPAASPVCYGPSCPQPQFYYGGRP